MKIDLEIGGYRISIDEPENHPRLAWPMPPFESFQTQPGSHPDINVKVTVASHLPELPRGPLRFDAAHGLWKLFESDDGLVIESISPNTHQLRACALVSDDYKSVCSWILPELQMGQVGWCPMHLFNPLVEVCLLSHMAREGTVLLHAAGLSSHEQGYLFTGASGAGKSTIADFFSERGARILSDERIIIRDIVGRFMIHGTPWVGSGNYAANKSCPLTQLFCISHGTGRHTMSSMPPRAVAQELLRQSFLPLWDRGAMLTTMEVVGDLVQHVDCRALAPLKSPDIVDFIFAQRPHAVGTS
ncbi:MAG TPA: hypothetical protein VN638_11585 [Nitrospiraceae bacterium]|nr:hypothetical protein [Nitrospiraceae bacterium]